MRIFILFLFISLMGCTKTVYVPTQTKIKTIYKDTAIIIKDTIYMYLPAEEKEVKTTADSSHLETTYAKSDAWVDDDGQLNHTLSNKTDEPLKGKQDTVIIIQTVDKTVEEETPVPVKIPEPYIPKWCWLCVVFTVGVIVYIITRIWLKFKVV